VPRILRHPDIDPALRFDPFGWNAEAIELNRLHRSPAVHPDLTVVRRVNSRSFGRRLEAELDPASPPVALVHGVAELEAYLREARSDRGWVTKAEFGNAGLGNRRLGPEGLSETDRRWVAARLAEDDVLVVEPWVDRERDWSMVFPVPFAARELRVHETIYTRDGGLIGVLFDPTGEPPGAPTEQLEQTARGIAARLASEGYSGPVCVDAMSYRSGDAVGLRSLVDLNCRRAMSDPAHRLWRRLGAERTLLYRFFRLDKLELPAETTAAGALLGEGGYDRDERTGVLLGSPLRVHDDGGWRRPTKLAVLILGQDRQDVLERETRFRRRFEK
jgi:hypothetical protein